MNYIISKKFDSTFTINFIGHEILTPTKNTLYLRVQTPVVGIKNIKSFSAIIRGENTWQYVRIYFKFQNKYDSDTEKCGDCWSNLMPISELTGVTFIPSRPTDMEFFFYRIDDPPFDNQHSRTDIHIGDNDASIAFSISGEYEFNWTDGPFTLVSGTTGTDEMVFVPADIYKIFSVSDYQVLADDPTNLELHYRITQDNGRTYSKWEPLNKANISTYKFNTLRFARIEYKAKLIYPSTIPNNVYDIMIIGDFQNVSANYLKTNRYGIRQDCVTGYLNGPGGSNGTSGSGSCAWNINTSQSGNTDGIAPGNGTPTKAMSDYELNMNFWTQGLSCYSSDPNKSYGNLTTTVNADGTTTTTAVNNPGNSVSSALAAENAANSSTLWNPYDITQIMNYANLMANQLSSIFAWDIDYHLTDPDSNGIDFVLHEYQLFNIIDMKKVKVLVPDNKFPDNMVKFNQFSLDLFDTFEIHILKDEFKNKFGIDKRPAENDIIFFCNINRLFYVKHAQIFRDVMNAGYYYKVILEKYEQKANIRNLHEESKAVLDILTKNTTMDELFGVEKTNEENTIANLDQFKPFTFDPMRYVVNNKVIRIEQSLYNGNFDFSKTHYDFKDSICKTAIIYKKTDNVLLESSNRSIVCWFNFNNNWDPEKPSKKAIDTYNVDQKTNFWFLDNFDKTNNKGYRLWYFKGNINFQLNDQYYKLICDSSATLLTNIWYALVVNVDQRQKVVNMKIYTRENDYNITFFQPDTYQKETISWTDTTGYTSLISNGFKPVNNDELRNSSTEYALIKESNYENIYTQSFEHDNDIIIEGSDIKYTNLRILSDVIQESEIFNILNQFYIDNAEKVLLADNADKNIYTENYKNKNWV